MLRRPGEFVATGLTCLARSSERELRCGQYLHTKALTPLCTLPPEVDHVTVDTNTHTYTHIRT